MIIKESDVGKGVWRAVEQLYHAGKDAARRDSDKPRRPLQHFAPDVELDDEDCREFLASRNPATVRRCVSLGIELHLRN